MNAGEKRKRGEDRRPACRYWKNCYQKSPAHLRKFKHPSPERDTRTTEPVAKKRKSPGNGDSTANDAAQVKKQSTTPEVIQKTDEAQKPVVEKTKEDSSSIEESTHKDSNSKEESADKDSNSIAEKAEKDSNSIAEQPEKDTNSIEEKTKKDSKSTDEKIEKDSKSTDEKIEKDSESTDEKIEKDSKSTDEKIEKDSESTDEKIEKDSNSNEDTTKKALDSCDKSNNKIVETPKVTPSTPSNIDSLKNTGKGANDDDPHSESAKLIRQIFLFSMPQDFYKFYDFCTELKSSDPTTALKIADLKLVGPYDVLSGEITSDTPDRDKLLGHWRYYYDPPEFQTIVKGNDREGLHFGYWRDRPSSDPVFVAMNSSNVSHKIKPAAENIFGAIANYVEERAKKANPFEKTSFFNLLGKLKAFAKKHNISLDTQSAKMKSREKMVVARTIHGAGIVCPYNKKTQVGYRELSVTDNQLLKIVKKIEDAKDDQDRAGPRAELGEIVRLATIAGDECDFGTCLELGHDLLSTGCTHVQSAALAVLSIAYSQLERTEFLKIVETHMKDRKKGCNCSALSTRKLINLS